MLFFVTVLTNKLVILTISFLQCMELQFRVANVKGDDAQIQFCTSFPSYAAMEAFYNYLGPAVDNIIYSSEKADKSVSRKCRPQALPPMEEFFFSSGPSTIGVNETRSSILF